LLRVHRPASYNGGASSVVGPAVMRAYRPATSAGGVDHGALRRLSPTTIRPFSVFSGRSVPRACARVKSG
jgi:hypothetical protein